MPKALIVDDNAINRKLLSRMLLKLEWNFDEVDNGQLAVDALCEKQYELVLMDIQMPVLDGVSATKIIRKFETKENRKVAYIIAVTAHGYSGYEAECLASGMDAYLEKPFTFTQFRDKLALIPKITE